VAVQPGTNAYLVVASIPFWVRPGYINSNSAFARSTNGGLTFAPTVTLDTFSGFCGQPHVVADSAYIICDYSGGSGGNQMMTEARTSANTGDSWSEPARVTDLDTLYSSYLNGGKLAIDRSGSVHAALMVCDLVNWEYEIYYACSNDHGLSLAAARTSSTTSPPTLRPTRTSPPIRPGLPTPSGRTSATIATRSGSRPTRSSALKNNLRSLPNV